MLSSDRPKEPVSNTVPVQIRSATASDIPAILAVEKDAPAAAHWSPQQYQTAVEGTEPPRAVLVLEDNGKVCAFLVARRFDRDAWEIENIAVATASQRRGLGTQLLHGFQEFARSNGARRILLEARRSNASARALYEKSGFVEKGHRPRYYQSPQEDSVLYHIVLT